MSHSTSRCRATIPGPGQWKVQSSLASSISFKNKLTDSALLTCRELSHTSLSERGRERERARERERERARERSREITSEGESNRCIITRVSCRYRGFRCASRTYTYIRVILGPGGLPKLVRMLVVISAIFLVLVMQGIVWINRHSLD